MVDSQFTFGFIFFVVCLMIIMLILKILGWIVRTGQAASKQKSDDWFKN